MEPLHIHGMPRGASFYMFDTLYHNYCPDYSTGSYFAPIRAMDSDNCILQQGMDSEAISQDRWARYR